MPIFYFKCKSCEKITRKIANSEPKDIPCKYCKSNTVRTPDAPHADIKEFRDNGFAPKRIEAYHDIKELLEERDAATKPSKD